MSVIFAIVLFFADFTQSEKQHIRLHLQEMWNECAELRDATNAERRSWAESHGMTRNQVITYCERLKLRITRIRDLEEYPAWLVKERIHELHDKLLEEER